MDENIQRALVRELSHRAFRLPESSRSPAPADYVRVFGRQRQRACPLAVFAGSGVVRTLWNEAAKFRIAKGALDESQAYPRVVRKFAAIGPIALCSPSDERAIRANPKRFSPSQVQRERPMLADVRDLPLKFWRRLVLESIDPRSNEGGLLRRHVDLHRVRPRNVPPLSCGRIRKRDGSRWRRASPWYFTTGEREDGDGHDDAPPSVNGFTGGARPGFSRTLVDLSIRKAELGKLQEE
jgi:hypothetical protein